jgi:hypothetical protein
MLSSFAGAPLFPRRLSASVSIGRISPVRPKLATLLADVFEEEEDEHAVLVAVAGPKADQIRKELPVAPIAGDWLIAALRRDEGPIVIPDARAVEGNPEVARRLDNRTVVNMPIGVVDRALGILGSNGAEAVAAAENEAFDLYILDSVMPVMSGREACERIRSARPDARFLFTSGYGGRPWPLLSSKRRATK